MPGRCAGERPALERRVLLRGAAGLVAAATGACGFEPLYQGGGGPRVEDAAVRGELAATRVPVIPERLGQLLRRNLQHRLGSAGGEPAAARWELAVAPTISAEALGILRDGSATRVRYIGTANWTLSRLSPRATVASGFERAFDAYNIQANQYFAADISREATERRLAEQLAEEVATRVAVLFRGLGEGTPPQLIEPVTPPITLPSPSPAGGSLPLPLPGGGLEGGIGPTGIVR